MAHATATTTTTKIRTTITTTTTITTKMHYLAGNMLILSTDSEGVQAKTPVFPKSVLACR